MNRDVRLSIKRVSILDALFLCLICGLFSSLVKAKECDLSGQAEQVRVRSVVDGDTVSLVDGRKVRLIGINTPEVGRKGALSEPFADKARRRLASLLADSSYVYLKVGEEPRDRYGRTLAHLFTERRESVEVALIREGLGFAIAIPPNILMLDCLLEAQAVARAAGLGVWSDSYFLPRPSDRLKRADTGFRFVSGVVERVSIKEGGSWWILLSGQLALQVSKRSQAFFDPSLLAALKGRRVVVNGWLIRKNLSSKQKAKGYKPYILSVKHPSSFLEPTVK